MDMVYVALCSDPLGGICYGVDADEATAAVANALLQCTVDREFARKVRVYHASKDWDLEAWSIVATKLKLVCETEIPESVFQKFRDAYSEIEDIVIHDEIVETGA